MHYSGQVLQKIPFSGMNSEWWQYSGTNDVLVIVKNITKSRLQTLFLVMMLGVCGVEVYMGNNNAYFY